MKLWGLSVLSVSKKRSLQARGLTVSPGTKGDIKHSI